MPTLQYGDLTYVALSSKRLIHNDYDPIILCSGLMWSVLLININIALRMGYTEVATFTKTILLG